MARKLELNDKLNLKIKPDSADLQSLHTKIGV